MPFTFLPHQAPVLPLKIVAPRWFDGTALVVGSMVPDLVFLTDGTSYYIDAHTVGPQLWFCLPLTVVVTCVFKRVVAGPLGAHLPRLGSFQLHDYARLSAWRMPGSIVRWIVIVISALIGSFSHIALDSFTHGYGWATQRFDWLQQEVYTAPIGRGGHVFFVYDALQVSFTVVGALVTIMCAWYIGRRRLVRTWYPEPYRRRPTASSWGWLIGWTALGAAVGGVLAALTHDVGPRHVVFFRVADLAFVGLAIGCAFATRRMADLPIAEHADDAVRLSPRGRGSGRQAVTAS